MSAVSPLWTFTDCVPSERQQRLLSVRSFDEVIQVLQAGTIASFAIEGRDNVGRVFFLLSVTEQAYDAFFNSPNGYRAQYCLGDGYGSEQNKRLMRSLSQVCLAYSEKWPQQTFPYRRVVASLNGVGAKVWITESDIPNVDEVHINYEPWVQKARCASTGTTADRAARASAGVGVLAPVGTLLEIKGGWVSQDCNEWLDPKKVHRSEEIRDYGFT